MISSAPTSEPLRRKDSWTNPLKGTTAVLSLAGADFRIQQTSKPLTFDIETSAGIRSEDFPVCDIQGFLSILG